MGLVAYSKNLCIFTTPKEAARLVNGCKITADNRGDERNFLLTVVVSAGRGCYPLPKALYQKPPH